MSVPMKKPPKEEVVERCLALYLAGVPLSSIEKEWWAPSRVTLWRWAKEGVGTGGVPWQTVKDEREAAAAVAERQAHDTFTQSVRRTLEVDIIPKALEALMHADEWRASDVDRLVRLYTMLSNERQRRLEFATWFVQRVFEICMEIMEESQFHVFRHRIEAMRAEVERKAAET